MVNKQTTKKMFILYISKDLCSEYGKTYGKEQNKS